MKKILFVFALCACLLAGCSSKAETPEYTSGQSDEYSRDGELCISYRVSVDPDLTESDLLLVFEDITHDDDYYLHTVFYYDDPSLIFGTEPYNVAVLEETSPGAKPEITRPAAGATETQTVSEDYYYEHDTGIDCLIYSLPFENINFNGKILRIQYAGIYIDQQNGGSVPYLTVFIDLSALGEEERLLLANGSYDDQSPVLTIDVIAKNDDGTIILPLVHSGIYGDVGDSYLLCVFSNRAPLNKSPEDYTYDVVISFYQKDTYDSGNKTLHHCNRYVFSLAKDGIPIDFPPYSELKPYIEQ